MWRRWNVGVSTVLVLVLLAALIVTRAAEPIPCDGPSCGDSVPYAWVSLCIGSYWKGCLALAHSLQRVHGSPYPFIALTNDVSHVNPVHRAALLALHAGNQIRTLPTAPQRIPEHGDSQWKVAFYKAWAWGLPEVSKVAWLDADMMPVRNVDWLMHEPTESFVIPRNKTDDHVESLQMDVFTAGYDRELFEGMVNFIVSPQVMKNVNMAAFHHRLLTNAYFTLTEGVTVSSLSYNLVRGTRLCTGVLDSTGEAMVLYSGAQSQLLHWSHRLDPDPWVVGVPASVVEPRLLNREPLRSGDCRDRAQELWWQSYQASMVLGRAEAELKVAAQAKAWSRASGREWDASLWDEVTLVLSWARDRHGPWRAWLAHVWQSTPVVRTLMVGNFDAGTVAWLQGLERRHAWFHFVPTAAYTAPCSWVRAVVPWVTTPHMAYLTGETWIHGHHGLPSRVPGTPSWLQRLTHAAKDRSPAFVMPALYNLEQGGTHTDAYIPTNLIYPHEEAVPLLWRAKLGHDAEPTYAIAWSRHRTQWENVTYTEVVEQKTKAATAFGMDVVASPVVQSMSWVVHMSAFGHSPLSRVGQAADAFMACTTCDEHGAAWNAAVLRRRGVSVWHDRGVGFGVVAPWHGVRWTVPDATNAMHWMWRSTDAHSHRLGDHWREALGAMPLHGSHRGREVAQAMSRFTLGEAEFVELMGNACDTFTIAGPIPKSLAKQVGLVMSLLDGLGFSEQRMQVSLHPVVRDLQLFPEPHEWHTVQRWLQQLAFFQDRETMISLNTQLPVVHWRRPGVDGTQLLTRNYVLPRDLRHATQDGGLFGPPQAPSSKDVDVSLREQHQWTRLLRYRVPVSVLKALLPYANLVVGYEWGQTLEVTTALHVNASTSWPKLREHFGQLLQRCGGSLVSDTSMKLPMLWSHLPQRTSRAQLLWWSFPPSKAVDWTRFGPYLSFISRTIAHTGTDADVTFDFSGGPDPASRRSGKPSMAQLGLHPPTKGNARHQHDEL